MACLAGSRCRWGFWQAQPPVPAPKRIQRFRSATATPAVGAAGDAFQEKRTPMLGQLGTVISSDKKANWLAPNDDSMAAKGVVLFMHGFSQGPNAYYENLKGLADAGFLVVAPEPPFAPTPKQQQEDMVEFAEHFRSKLVANELTGLPLPSSTVASNIALLGHSVGAGLATHVAQMAAAKQQPYKAVMYMAPQTQVVKDFSPSDAISKWPVDLKGTTKFALQYGLKDDLAPPELSLALIKELRAAGLPIQESDIKPYGKGTHVGFQDQVVLGDYELTSDVLPWLSQVLLWLVTSLSAIGVPFLPYLTAKLLQKILDAELDKDADKTGAAAARSSTSSPVTINSAVGIKNEAASAVLQKAFLNPQDIALLEVALQKSADKTPRAVKAKRSELLQAWKGEKDGIKEPEDVRIASKEATIAQYTTLLVAVGVAFLALANSTVKGWLDDGQVHWLPLIGTVVTGYFTFQGAYHLNLQSYVMNEQRPDSRKTAKTFMLRELH